ncbi:hypothetical protein ACOTTU_03475 [Roseobacter sp. EG26]|uniref:hypothetical protein n=1 Tax=Roseobacter sp. EG26 TaxID=3412477 RepID=UPI003CE4604C
MSQTYDDRDPRHMKLFELIRQKNQADTAVARLREADFSEITTEQVAQLQQAATRSLQARV